MNTARLQPDHQQITDWNKAENINEDNNIESYPVYPGAATNKKHPLGTAATALNSTNMLMEDPVELSPPSTPTSSIDKPHYMLHQKRAYTTPYFKPEDEFNIMPTPIPTPEHNDEEELNISASVDYKLQPYDENLEQQQQQEEEEEEEFYDTISTPQQQQQQQMGLKRYSTVSSYRTATESSLQPQLNKMTKSNFSTVGRTTNAKTTTSIRESTVSSSAAVSLCRHHTTGHTLKSARQRMADKERLEMMRRSEEFQKELSARRKAFHRLSGLGGHNSKESSAAKNNNEDDDRVLIGTRISEGHRNYVLMYNMLTGIRIAVSRVTAKMNRPLIDEDYEAAHKLAFDVIGDELTPGAKYDFKFKDYAPWVFRNLREKFGVDPADYLISLTSKYILSELGSPGKSGSFFYYSKDYRFIIKTIHHTEHKFMRKILKEYYEHICDNPDTLLCRYYGLHRIKLPHGNKIHFVVMSNVFPPSKDIHETYDLKGSTLGRLLPEEEIRKNPYAVMKDLNWERKKRKLQLGPIKRRLFIGQLVRDVTLLSQLNIMDYSLLIGIHDMLRGNKDNIRDTTLQTFQPDTKSVQRRNTLMNRKTSKAQVVRTAIAEAKFNKLDASKLPEDTQERRNCAFYAEEGGFQATDESNRPLPVLYSLGIIDILTPYDLKKKSEHLYKSFTTQDKYGISAVKPSQYGQRFLEFMANAVLENNDDIPKEYKIKNRIKHFLY